MLSPKSELHFEFWVALSRERLRLRRLLRRVYGIARPITQRGGGSGPWVFLVRPDPVKAKSARLRAVLGLNSQEDLWIEIAFYPSSASMKKIIRKIWEQPKFSTLADGLDKLVSRIKRAYE